MYIGKRPAKHPPTPVLCARCGKPLGAYYTDVQVGLVTIQVLIKTPPAARQGPRRCGIYTHRSC